MKKFVFFVVGIMLCGLVGCGQAKTAEEPKAVAVIINEPPIPKPIEEVKFVDRTAELKLASYEAFLDDTEENFYDDHGYFDIAAFAEQAGCECVIKEHEIKIRPLDYNAAADFEVVLEIAPLTRMVTGDTIYAGWNGENFVSTEVYESASDFTTKLTLGDSFAEISYDELDHLWREIRLMTAPDDKAVEINAAIDAEIESYYVVDEMG